MSKAKRILFPFGIFFLLVLLFCGGAAVSSAGYFYVSSRSAISEFEHSIQSDLVPVLDACVQMGELDGGKGSGIRMSALFKDYHAGELLYKAFFVKEDGTIIAHSDQNESLQLKGNIATDEFSYNLDLIFTPLKKNMKDPFFSDYFLIEKKVPFDKEKIRYLKKYFYENIDRNGWILCRQVTLKGKPFGVVAFLVAKDPIYTVITNEFEDAVFHAEIGIASGFGLAFILSLIIFARYRMIYKKALRVQKGSEEFSETKIPSDGTCLHAGENSVASEGSTVVSEKQAVSRELPANMASILDAIPVRKK